MKHMSFIHSSTHSLNSLTITDGALPFSMPGSLGTWVCLGPPHLLCRPSHPPESLLEDLQLLVLLIHQAGHLHHLVLEHAQLTALLLDQRHVPLQFYLLLLVQFPWGVHASCWGWGPAWGLLEGHSRSARPPKTTRQSTLQEFSGGFSNGQEVCLQKKEKTNETAHQHHLSMSAGATRQPVWRPPGPSCQGLCACGILGHLQQPASASACLRLLSPLETALLTHLPEATASN